MVIFKQVVTDAGILVPFPIEESGMYRVSLYGVLTPGDKVVNLSVQGGYTLRTITLTGGINLVEGDVSSTFHIEVDPTMPGTSLQAYIIVVSGTIGTCTVWMVAESLERYAA